MMIYGPQNVFKWEKPKLLYLERNSSHRISAKAISYASTYVINSDRSKNSLQKPAENISYFCEENHINLKGTWITRE